MTPIPQTLEEPFVMYYLFRRLGFAHDDLELSVGISDCKNHRVALFLNVKRGEDRLSVPLGCTEAFAPGMLEDQWIGVITDYVMGRLDRAAVERLYLASQSRRCEPDIIQALKQRGLFAPRLSN